MDKLKCMYRGVITCAQPEEVDIEQQPCLPIVTRQIKIIRLERTDVS